MFTCFLLGGLLHTTSCRGPQIINEQNALGAKKSSMAQSVPSSKGTREKMYSLGSLRLSTEVIKAFSQEKVDRSQVISYDDSSLSFQGES